MAGQQLSRNPVEFGAMFPYRRSWRRCPQCGASRGFDAFEWGPGHGGACGTAAIAHRFGCAPIRGQGRCSLSSSSCHPPDLRASRASTLRRRSSSCSWTDSREAADVSRTRVPTPGRLTTTPSCCSRFTARVAVATATPYSFASARTAGSRVPTGYWPSATSRRSWSASCRYAGRGSSRSSGMPQAYVLCHPRHLTQMSQMN